METLKAPLFALLLAVPLTISVLIAEAMFDMRELPWAF